MEVEGSQASIQAGGAANPQALSIALVLPQPTAQTSTQTTQTQVPYYYENSVRIKKPTKFVYKISHKFTKGGNVMCPMVQSFKRTYFLR